MKRKVTLSVDSEIYKQFQKFCEENDIMLSKRIERIMREQLSKSLKSKSISQTKELGEFLRGGVNGSA
tara:strand:- start:223 stop:426 length:204 start_codon:yes stop_codon:yes gene_type:complete